MRKCPYNDFICERVSCEDCPIEQEERQFRERKC